tara:strand:- start:1344 stop:1595 length:252 start_codon:yes stop_codon:yes gene_type:complete
LARQGAVLGAAVAAPLLLVCLAVPAWAFGLCQGRTFFTGWGFVARKPWKNHGIKAPFEFDALFQVGHKKARMQRAFLASKQMF